MAKWVKRARYEMAAEASRPGVWKLRTGGWFVRGRVTDEKTGRQREVTAALGDERDADGAYAWLREELHRVRSGEAQKPTSRTRFAEYAAQLLERKIARGDLLGAKSVDKWKYTLEHHLVPAFGATYLDALSHDDVETWYDVTAKRVRTGEISSASANTHLAILRVILNAAFARRPADNPILGIVPFRRPPGVETYTEEAPNSLRPADVPRFLTEMRATFPQHYAMVTLGFATGLRPSTLRPLRRTGPTPDVLWEASELLIRRSQTQGEAVERTKTGIRQRLALPTALMDILRWHVEKLDEVQLASDLLFPSERGGYRAGSVLDKPFRHVGEAIGLSYRVTARAMRRTFQDLARAADVREIVTRSVSGHATEVMQYHYSTVAPDEQRESLAKVISIMQVKATG